MSQQGLWSAGYFLEPALATLGIVTVTGKDTRRMSLTDVLQF
jgi:hypothetical protein